MATLDLTGTTGAHRHPAARRVVFVVYPGVQLLDVVGPHEAFAAATALLARTGSPSAPPYDPVVCSPTGGLIASESGLALGATEPLGDPTSPIDTLLVPGGDGMQAARADHDLIAWIGEAARHARRVGSVCSGTFLLAESGVATGRRVTTHWARAARLAREFPRVEVDPDPIHVRDGRVWSSAGVTAGIDLALAMIEEDHGAALAQQIGQWLVMFLRRPGGQSQFAAPVWAGAAEHDGIRAAVARVHEDPAAAHSVTELATTASMSTRHFTRVFAREVGTPPARYVEQVRVAAARHLLESTSTTTEVVATRCGFGTAETMRRAFLRHVGVPPGAYRRSFGHGEPSTRSDPSAREVSA